MSKDTDITVKDVDAINKLMSELFNEEPSAADLATVVSEAAKMEGSLEDFMKDEQLRREKIIEWIEDPHKYIGDENRPAKPPMFESMFEGVKDTGLNCPQDIQPVIAFEEEDSGLAGVKTSGLEDIHDFFAVPHTEPKGKFAAKIGEIDEHIEEMKNLPEYERRKLDAEFASSLGMDLDRLREVAGATSAWNEIREIKIMLEEVEQQSKKIRLRFENFIDIYVKDKIPR